MNKAIEFQEFSFRYPYAAADIIKNATFTVEKGSLTLLYGLSGSGKSTLCYAMTGLIPWSVRGFMKGSVRIMGKDTKRIKPNQFAGEVGYLMQNPDSQFATLNVRDELIFAAENVRISKEDIEKRFVKIVELLDLGEYLNRNVTQLSSGEKQRVILGSILIMEPTLLILDEPLSFLDFPNRMKLLQYLKKIRLKFRDLTIIISEHRIHEISQLAPNFLEINNGEISMPVTIPNTESKFSIDAATPFNYVDLIHFYGFQEESFSPKITQDNPPALSFEGINFFYNQDQGNFEQKRKTVLKDISFQINSAEIISVIGPNGIGKTTLLYLIAGVLSPSNGEIRFHDQDISNFSYAKYSQNIGLIFQNPDSQLLKNSIRKEIEFGPKNFHMEISEEELHKYTQFIFPTNKQETETLLDLHPFNLSWGEKRRLNLASLFAYHPEIYLFDEPFTGQDYIIRKKLVENIKSISSTSGIAIISSHDEEILQLCDRVFLLDKSGFKKYKKLGGNSHL